MQPFDAFEHMTRSAGGLVALTFFAGVSVTHGTIASLARPPDPIRRLTSFAQRWLGPAFMVTVTLFKAYTQSPADLRPLWPWLGGALAIGVPVRLAAPAVGRAIGLPKLSHWMAKPYHLLADVTGELLKPVVRVAKRVVAPVVHWFAYAVRVAVAPAWRVCVKIAQALPQFSPFHLAIGTAVTLSVGLVALLAATLMGF